MSARRPGPEFQRVGYAEEAMRHQVRAAGGTWDRATKLWRIPFHAVIQLGIEERIACWSRPEPWISKIRWGYILLEIFIWMWMEWVRLNT